MDALRDYGDLVRIKIVQMIMQTAFHAGHLPAYAEVMRQQTASMLEGWHEGDVVDMVDEMFRLTMSITLGALRVPRAALKPDTRVVLLPRCLPVPPDAADTAGTAISLVLGHYNAVLYDPAGGYPRERRA